MIRRVLPRLALVAFCILFAITIAAVLNAGYYLAQVLALEARGSIRSDSQLFLIIGRGMLNGLRPYVDLFESKPPGMFFLFALSLMATGDDRIALFLQVSIFIAFPLLLAGFAWLELRRAGQDRGRYVLIGVALILGILLALYLEERSGNFHAESFGAFFASLYLLHVFMCRDPSRKTALLVNACLLLATVGLKEPFILTTLAGTLLIVRDRKHFLHAFIIPLILAIVLGVAVLTTFGYLGPYLTLYLPAMLGHRIDANPLEPLWVRAFQVGRVFANLTDFYTAPLFGGVVAVLWMFAPALRQRGRALAPLFLTLATSVVAYVYLVYTGILLAFARAIAILPVSFDGAGGFLAVHLGGYVLLLALLVTLLLCENRRGLAVGTLLNGVALCLVALSVGVAEYLDWHFGFALPLFFALSLLFVRYAVQQPPLSIPTVAVTLLVVVAGLLYRPNPAHLQELRKYLPPKPSANVLPSRRFDELLDRCRITSYFLEGARPELALAHHSPLGPIFALDEDAQFFSPDHPLMEVTYANIRTKAQLIVLGNGKTLNDISADLSPMFSDQAPTCAAGFLPLDHLTLFFRKS